MRQGLQIVVKCPDCGERRVAPEVVTVRSCLDNDLWSYRFTCPSCGRPAAGESSTSALKDAIDAGAGFEPWVLPPGLDDRPDGPPFTVVDVLELHLLLLEPDWFDEITRCELDAER